MELTEEPAPNSRSPTSASSLASNAEFDEDPRGVTSVIAQAKGFRG